MMARQSPPGAEKPPETTAQNKVARLFTYLEKALALDDNIVRDFAGMVVPPSPWWIASLPNDAENLFIRELETEEESESEMGDVWLRVEKKGVKDAPEPPKALKEWLEEVVPTTAPKAKEKIEREVRFDDDSKRVQAFKKFKKEFEQGDEPPAILDGWVVLNPTKVPDVLEKQYVADFFDDHPELKKALKSYTENEWKSWAERVIKIYTANLLYDQLYALRLLLKNEGDSLELLWGQGFLTWNHKKCGSISTPVFLTPLTLEFDATKRVITLSPDPLLRGYVELSALHEIDNPAEMDLITWADRTNANPFNFWHYQSVKDQMRYLVNVLDANGEDSFDDKLLAHPNGTAHPTAWNAPVIFTRKRNNDLWSKYAGIIRRDIEQNDVEATEFIRDLVGDYKETTDSVEEGTHEAGLKESELFFPLPWNDEQKRIAERLDARYGMVVKGPPGTGKSHTIANLISRFLAQGKTVLVTSQTSKALDVLRDKLPENIRSLAVSQLHQTARKDDVLQSSISEISSNLGERHTKFSEKEAERIRRDLSTVREDRAELAAEIRQFILTDSTEKITIDGSEIAPMDAAKFVSDNQDREDLAWFTDEVSSYTELDFTEKDLDDAFALLSELESQDRKLYDYDLPAELDIPNEDTVAGAFASFRELTTKAKTSTKVFKEAVPGFDKEQLVSLWNKLLDSRKTLQAINKPYEQEVFDQCATSQAARDKWSNVLSRIGEKVQLISTCNQKLLGYVIVGSLELPPKDLIEAITQLKVKAGEGKKIGTFGKMLLSANAKQVLETYLIDGRAPDTTELIAVLESKILIEQAERDIKTLLSQGFAGLKSSLELENETDIIQLEVLIASLSRAVSYTEDFAEISTFCKKMKELAELDFTVLADIERLMEIIASDVSRVELASLERTFAEWHAAVIKTDEGLRHPIAVALAEALEKRTITAWKKATGELDAARDNQKKSLQLKEVATKIKRQAPNLYADMEGLASYKEPFKAPANLALAWKVARLSSWLDEVHDRADIDEMQAQMGRLTKKEEQLNSELVTILAWQRQIDKVTKIQRDALMAWSLAMKKYGKGTGKYSAMHLRAAQEALKEAKNAVPVWIMPLNRVAQMFPEPQAGMFDVVIFDEASQCDIRGITIGYLGKKLLVVGDPEQISPAGLFENQEKVFELISRFLHDIPFKDSFSITSSLFDLAKIRLSNIIQLNEHFRCVPDIIAFSNHHVYEGKLKPLRYPNPKGMLKPALVPVYVEKGYMNTNAKVNEPEAKAIVEKLIECLNDPAYQTRPDGKPCTFGIVSLLAEDQAKYIEKLLRQEVGKGTLTEKLIEERRIECGDAYKFQGDERDVMFLSMVKALDPKNPNDTVAPLVNEDAKRRFNVAASRARDQMFLFHSLPLESLHNKSDWRYKILAWFYDPKQEELNAGRAALKREFDAGRASQFSYDVGNVLIDRGYQVIPEYPVIGYRIDLVVQGAETRLAVECDGDQYHTLDNWEEDQIRERQLRRAGWEFWRLTGSAYYRYKGHALESLWTKLDEMGIKPLVDQ